MLLFKYPPDHRPRPYYMNLNPHFSFILKTSETLLGVLLCFAFGLFSLQADTPVPSAENISTLSWVDGPPVLNTSRPDDSYLYWFRPNEADLVLASGTGSLRFDPVSVGIETVTVGERALQSQMLFQVRLADGALWQARLTQPVKRNYEFPIRINESGNWFHHVAVYGLELCAVNADGSLSDTQVVPIEGSLEWRAWADRGTFSWDFNAPADLEIKSATITWKIPEAATLMSTVADTAATNWAVSMAYTLDNGIPTPAVERATPVQVTLPQQGGAVVQDSMTSAIEIQMAELAWPDANGSDYPASDLDRITRLPLQLSNPTDAAQDVRLRFIHPRHPVTGFVPMLLDDQGRQTGIPVQTSKNWHKKLGGTTDLPYDGQWIRTSARVTVPANTTLDLEYAIVHAQWQGLPAASVGQLSLVGWGGNGFWTQMALGSWGETFCFQPGRVLRRAMLTDIRPTLQRGLGKGKELAWTSNVGGGDVGLIKDTEGKYLAWVDAKSTYLAGGPNRAEVLIEETLATGAATLKTNIILPRSNDYVRTSLRVRFDVSKPLPFKRFALLQVGTDYYSTGIAHSLAYGSDASDTKVVRLEQEKPNQKLVVRKELKASNAWFALFGDLPEASSRNSYGERGLIVREFQGRVAGKPVDHAWLASYAVKDNAPNFNAEITVAPDVSSFEAGDYIEALFEWVILPPKAEDYYGPNADFKGELAAKERTWELVPGAAVEGSGVQEFTFQVAQSGLSLKSGSGLASLAVRGFADPNSGQWFERVDGNLEVLGARFSEEAEPQWVWNPLTGFWDCYLSVRSPSQIDGCAERIFVFE
ncbi:Unannotated [Lentimonas sp. CC4]|nr:Unannotated [Lentimonas sp. CC4]CAA6683469.1 Unannotated [Lentimonas sp. CC6]CAA7078054.1 Unannotated [Lentimonas sp. CC4]CAA7171649.1 Unannotated [Lentimonas sp. CC21]CAA7181435.1 Unannotated [Lentimonas sp. CC8]